MFTIDDAKVRQLASGFHIPARPEILVRLQAEQQAEYTDLQMIADLIAADISLSACVLKTINSPVFGLNRAITDIRQSVMLLGLKNIVPLVTFFALRNAMAGRKSCISLERFWDTAIDTANVMVLLLQRMQLVQPPEDVYAAGLFHNCGIPLMAERYPDYKELLHQANTTPDQRITQLEMARYHTSHAVVGYFVATSTCLTTPAS
jgi:HD-like signal output (HDOD) protein